MSNTEALAVISLTIHFSFCALVFAITKPALSSDEKLTAREFAALAIFSATWELSVPYYLIYSFIMNRKRNKNKKL